MFQFGLACREWLRTMVGSVRNAALPVALLLTGYISDRCESLPLRLSCCRALFSRILSVVCLSIRVLYRWGRRTAFCVFSGCAGTLGLVKSFSRDYRMLLAFEFLEAALGYGFNSAGYVMGSCPPYTTRNTPHATHENVYNQQSNYFKITI